MRLSKILPVVLLMSVLFTFSVFAQDIYIDGEKVTYDETTGVPFAEDGVIFVPLYPTFEAFGNDGIIQDNPNGTVVITKGGISVSCNTSDNLFIRNGTKIKAPTGLVWRGGPLYVPTDIFKAFDADVYINGSGVIITRKEEAESGAAIFGASDDEAYRGSKYFGAKYEPSEGLYLGCTALSDPLDGINAFAQSYGKDAAAFTVYADITKPFSAFDKELKYAAESGKLVRFAISGMDFYAPDTEKLTQLARHLESSGARILLDIAPFVTCISSENYFADSETYKTAFTTISGIFKSNAPSVATVWQMCTCAKDTVQQYYPGDMYTDYAEIVICPDNIDTYRELPFFLSAYGYKKPIILEADISHTGLAKYGNDFCLSFCTYLPIKHPQIKMAFFPVLSDKSADTGYLNAVRTGVSGTSYADNPNSTRDSVLCCFEMGNGIEVPASNLTIYTSYGEADKKASYVIYRLNGEQVQVSPVKNIPFEAEINLVPFAGKTVSLEAIVYDDSNVPTSHTSYTLNVGTRRITDNDTEAEKQSPYGYIAAILAAIAGIFVLVKKINDIFC